MQKPYFDKHLEAHFNFRILWKRLSVKTPEWRYWYRSGLWTYFIYYSRVSVIDSEHVFVWWVWLAFCDIRSNEPQYNGYWEQLLLKFQENSSWRSLDHLICVTSFTINILGSFLGLLLEVNKFWYYWSHM